MDTAEKIGLNNTGYGSFAWEISFDRNKRIHNLCTFLPKNVQIEIKRFERFVLHGFIVSLRSGHETASVFLTSKSRSHIKIDGLSFIADIFQDVMGNDFIMIQLALSSGNPFKGTVVIIVGVEDTKLNTIAGINESQAFIQCKNWSENL